MMGVEAGSCRCHSSLSSSGVGAHASASPTHEVGDLAVVAAGSTGSLRPGRAEAGLAAHPVRRTECLPTFSGTRRSAKGRMSRSTARRCVKADCVDRRGAVCAMLGERARGARSAKRRPTLRAQRSRRPTPAARGSTCWTTSEMSSSSGSSRSRSSDPKRLVEVPAGQSARGRRAGRRAAERVTAR
jgi:hypothetical protein